eukprot:13157004-Ditylum_brightwellii.AAC.3
MDVYQGMQNASSSIWLCKAKKYCKKYCNNNFKIGQEFLECIANDIIDGDTIKNKRKIIYGIKIKKAKAYVSNHEAVPQIPGLCRMSYRYIVIKEERDAALFVQHICHFSQATGTLFTIDPIISQFGEYAEKPKVQQFRDGTLDIEILDVNDYTKDFLTDIQQQ